VWLLGHQCNDWLLRQFQDVPPHSIRTDIVRLSQDGKGQRSMRGILGVGMEDRQHQDIYGL
jgi:hypothetical protein